MLVFGHYTSRKGSGLVNGGPVGTPQPSICPIRPFFRQIWSSAHHQNHANFDHVLIRVIFQPLNPFPGDFKVVYVEDKGQCGSPNAQT